MAAPLHSLCFALLTGWICARLAACKSELDHTCKAGMCVDDEDQEDVPLLQLRGVSGHSSEEPPRKKKRATSIGLGCQERKHVLFNASVAQVRWPFRQFPGAHGRVRSAVCFSGGGNRALSIAMGALRGLTSLGVLPGVDALSSVSGGTWATSQYVFANRSLSSLLGNMTEPGQLTMAALEAEPWAEMAQTANTSFLAVAKAEVRRTIAACHGRALELVQDWDLWRCVLHNVSLNWIDIVGKVFLGPYGLDDDHYLAASPDDVKRIVERNTMLSVEDFVTPMPERPAVYVMVGALGAPLGHRGAVDNLVSLQMSPDYLGSPFFPNGSDVTYESADNLANISFDTQQFIGGGFVETFAVGGQAPKSLHEMASEQDAALPAPYRAFNLPMAVGISSAAFSTAFSHRLAHQVFSPRVLYWAVQPPKRQEAAMHQMGDGGNVENLGLLPMLQRGVTTAAVFVSGGAPISYDLDLCDVPPGYDLTRAAATALTCLFGYCTDVDDDSGFFSNNHVFRREELAPLLCKLQEARDAGKPAVQTQTLEVLTNTWWGLLKPYNVTVIWFYNDKVTDFEDLLPNDTRAALDEGEEGPFAHFPRYKTGSQNPEDVAAYTIPQVNLLAAQVEYMVEQNAAELCRLFNCSPGGST